MYSEIDNLSYDEQGQLHTLGHKTIQLYLEEKRKRPALTVTLIIANLFTTMNMLRRHFDSQEEFLLAVHGIGAKVLREPLYGCHVGRSFDADANPVPGYVPNAGFGPDGGFGFGVLGADVDYTGTALAKDLYDKADAATPTTGEKFDAKQEAYGPTQPETTGGFYPFPPAPAQTRPGAAPAAIAEAVLTALKAIARADELMARANGKRG